MLRILLAALKSVTASKETYYHGTSSALARKILKEGFIPNPKQKIWDQDKGHLESYEGTYLTERVEVAARAAAAAVSKLGGDSVVFEVQIETKTGLMDEDELPHPNLSVSEEEALKEWFAEYEDEYEIEIAPQLKKKLTPLLEEWFYWEHEDQTDPESMTEAREAVIQALKGQDDFFHGNIRIDQPITFKGANKILAAIKFRFDGGIKYEVLYGTPSNFFVQDIKALNEEESGAWRDLHFS